MNSFTDGLIFGQGEEAGYQKLIKLESDKDLKKCNMEWLKDKHSKDEYLGTWCEIPEEVRESPPVDAEKVTIRPILIIVHGRIFLENAQGYKKGDEAWIRGDKFRELF